MFLMFDLIISLSLTKINQLVIEKEVRASKYNQLILTYEAECLWYKIPLHRQLYLESIALIKNVVAMDGWRQLSKVDGVLVSDATCMEYASRLDQQTFIIESSKMFAMSYLEYIKVIFDYVILEIPYIKISIFIMMSVGIKFVISKLI